MCSLMVSPPIYYLHIFTKRVIHPLVIYPSAHPFIAAEISRLHALGIRSFKSLTGNQAKHIHTLVPAGTAPNLHYTYDMRRRRRRRRGSDSFPSSSYLYNLEQSYSNMYTVQTLFYQRLKTEIYLNEAPLNPLL